jgi:hypothetical protein|tara:strand:+ start:1841 stop:2722 length:882 start_codon:yes stop_codon:yes gene_type:complete
MGKKGVGVDSAKRNLLRPLFQLQHEPLFWFLLAGALLFLADTWLGGSTDRPFLIEVSSGQIQSLEDKWRLQMGRPPTERELSSLIEDRVREEVLYREAIELGLDREDTIIRRRLAQKMSFLMEDTVRQEPASETSLAEFFAAEGQDYAVPALFSFSHIYFSGTGPETVARARAALAEIVAGGDSGDLGDPFMLSRSYAVRSLEDIGRLFGSDFATALGSLSPGEQWQGPISSSYGAHLVQLAIRRDAVMPKLADVIDRVRLDYQAEQRRKANEASYREMRARYQVALPGSPER